MKKIREEQVRASTDDYEDDKRRQGQKLVSDAKSAVDGGYVLTSSFDHDMAEDLQAQGFNLFKGISNNSLVIGPEDPNDPQSVLDWYDDLTEALKVLRKQYSDADLEEKGIYEGLYNILSAQKEALDDQVAAYRNSADVLKKNKEEVGKYDLSNDLSASKNFRDNPQPLSDSEEAKIDSKIQKTKEYKDAVEEAQETEAKWESGGFNKYGNVDNFNRDKIDWTKENLEKYKDFVAEQNKFNPGEIEEGGYSTVLGVYDNLYRESPEMPLMAYTPMLQTEDDTIDLDKLMKLDATGLERDINGEMIRVKGMIAGVEGGTGSDGKKLTKADIMAISGSSNDEIAQELYSGEMGDYSGMGWLSKYIGRSMHDAQAVAQEGKDNIESIYDSLYDNLAYGNDITTKNQLSNDLQGAFDDIAESLGKDSRAMTVSDVVGLTADDVELTDEQAAAINTLTEAATKYKTSIQGVAEAGEENGMFGGIENAVNGVSSAIQQMETISQNIDNIQSAYKACTTAMDEYNKYGYMSADALQGLLSMNDEYLACLDVVDGKLKINNERYADLIVAQYTEAEATAIDQAMNELNALQKEDAKKKTEDLTTATEEQQTALENAVPAIQNATTATGDLAIALATAQGAAEGDDAMQAKIDTITAALNTRLTAIHSNMQTAIKGGKELKNQLNGFNKTNKGSSSKSVTDAASAFDTLTKAMKEYNQYGYITVETMKSLMTLEDKFTSCLVKNGDHLEINANAFRKLVENQLKEEEANGKASKKATELSRILSYLDKNVHSSTITFEQLTDAIKGYGSALSDAKAVTDDFKGVWDNGKVVKEKTKKSRTGALDYEGTEAQSAALQSIKKYSEYDPDLINKAYNKDTGKIDLSGDVLKDAVVKSLEQQAKAARDENNAAANAIADSYETAANNIKNNVISVQDYFDGLGSTVEEFSSKIDDMQNAWTDLSDVTNEYNTYGGLSIDSIQKLLTMSPEYLQFLKLEGNQLVFNKEAMLAKTKADILAKAAELELKDETKDQAEILRALADSLDKGADSMEGMGKSADKLKTLMSQLNTVLNSFIGVFDDLNDKQSNDLKIQGEAWIDVIDKRIDALNEENDAQERSIELAKLQDEYERAKANKTVHVYGGRGQGFVWKADENAVREAGKNLSDKQREYKKKDEIDKLEKLKDKVQETNNLIGTSWDDYQKKLKYTAEFEAMTFEQMEGHYDGFKSSVLNNMQAIQGATNVKNVITDISNLISTLETLANILNILNGGSGDGGGVFGFINQIKNMFTGENGDFDLGGGFKKMFDGAAKVVSDGWNWITGKNRAGSAALKSNTTATLDILGNTIKVNTGDIQRVSGGFFERLVGAAKDNLGSIGKFFSGA